MGLATLLLTASILAAMFYGYYYTQKEVKISLDGSYLTFRTHQTTVDALLDEISLDIRREDIVLPSLEATLGDDPILVLRARPVLIEVDGEEIEIRTHGRAVGDALREAGVTLRPQDMILMEGQRISPETPLAPRSLGSRGTAGRRNLLLSLDPPTPRRIVIRRSVPLRIIDGGVPITIETTASTVGEALRAADIITYLGDRVGPELGSALSPGRQVYIQRAVPLTILVDGRHMETRTQAPSIVEALKKEGIKLRGKDYTIPERSLPLTSGMTVQVIRVVEKFIIQDEAIPFETAWKADSGMELDQRRLIQAGDEGLKRRLVRIVYENGQEKERILESEWVVEPPTTQVFAYGTNIVLRELSAPEGVVRYWRKIRVLATSYTAATCGKPRSHPYYGITYLGWQAKKGVIAIDPKVINLGTNMYVPGYGFGTAADTGGAIKGRRIDLAYDEDNLTLWNSWVDVYLLEPVPPPDRIKWVIPSWPAER